MECAILPLLNANVFHAFCFLWLSYLSVFRIDEMAPLALDHMHLHLHLQLQLQLQLPLHLNLKLHLVCNICYSLNNLGSVSIIDGLGLRFRVLNLFERLYMH